MFTVGVSQEKRTAASGLSRSLFMFLSHSFGHESAAFTAIFGEKSADHTVCRQPVKDKNLNSQQLKMLNEFLVLRNKFIPILTFDSVFEKDS